MDILDRLQIILVPSNDRLPGQATRAPGVFSSNLNLFSMKTIVLIFGLLAFPVCHVLSQSNLSFSRALLVTSEETVPDGHVWKVVSVLGSSGLTPLSTTSSSTSTQRIVVNSTEVFIAAWNYMFHGSSSTTATSTKTAAAAMGSITQLPIWLPEGTTLDTGLNTFGVSVIEFVID